MKKERKEGKNEERIKRRQGGGGGRRDKEGINKWRLESFSPKCSDNKSKWGNLENRVGLQ